MRAPVAQWQRLAVASEFAFELRLDFTVERGGFFSPRRDFGENFRRGRAFRKIGLVQFPALEIGEARRADAGIARREHEHLRALRQRGAIELHDVRARGEAVETVFALAIGHRVGAVLHKNADARNARFARVLNVVAVFIDENFADDERLVGEDAALQLHAVTRGVAREHRRAAADGLRGIDAVALHRAGADAHAIGERDGRVARDRADEKFEARAAAGRGGLERGVLETRAAGLIREARGQAVKDAHARERAAADVAHGHGVINGIANFGRGARAGFLEENPDAAKGEGIERVINHYRAGEGVDGEIPTEGTGGVNRATRGQAADGQRRGAVITGRRRDAEAVNPDAHGRENVAAIRAGHE